MPGNPSNYLPQRSVARPVLLSLGATKSRSKSGVLYLYRPCTVVRYLSTSRQHCQGRNHYETLASESPLGSTLAAKWRVGECTALRGTYLDEDRFLDHTRAPTINVRRGYPRAADAGTPPVGERNVPISALAVISDSRRMGA